MVQGYNEDSEELQRRNMPQDKSEEETESEATTYERLQDAKDESATGVKDYIMRGGGAPFGRPYDLGTPSLTERVVLFFKQKSFFKFETFERKTTNKGNKFTRYGASRYRGKLRGPSNNLPAPSKKDPLKK